MTKPHVVIICAGIFIFCWLILGFRGLDAAIIGPGCFLAGIAVKQREQEAAAAIDRLKATVASWFKS